MIKLEKTEVFGWESAIRGMRNPMNSWSKSDSCYIAQTVREGKTVEPIYSIGQNDLRLMKQLRKAGSDHAKYLRMINVTVDITAPTFWWAEFDTYKVGTVRNSCSKMHKIHVSEFTRENFTHEGCEEVGELALGTLDYIVERCEKLRCLFNETKEKKYWRALIELLPEGYNMRATVQLNYAVLNNMYPSRKPHKLDEWHVFCDWIETLPYAKELITGEE